MTTHGGTMTEQDSGSSSDAIRQDVRLQISHAVIALSGGRGDAFDEATVVLAQYCATPTGERVVVAELGTQLDDAVLRAWESGWQPADLHRLAVRGLEQSEQALAVDVMVNQLGAYAVATVDHRWHAQLAEIGDGRWWPRSQHLLVAHRGRGTDWLTLHGRSLAVLHLLLRLPRIERLTPLPGEVRPEASGADADRADRPAVDERILSRVRQLLAKAESSTFPAEAETFTAGAQSLMARHSIDAALVAAAEERAGHSTQGPGGRRIGLDNPYDGQKALLLNVIAQANRCRMVWSKDFGFGTVVGYESDLEAIEVLYTSLLIQATRAMTSAGGRKDVRGRSRTRSFRSSFLTAYASRIGERLEDASAAEVAAAESGLSESGRSEPGAADQPGKSPRSDTAGGGSRDGRAVVRVLADREEHVEDAVRALFPKVTKSGPRQPKDAEGWHSGRAAADRAHLKGQTTPLGTRRD